MKKLLCEFNGWFMVDIDKVNLTDCQTNQTKTAKEWLDIRDNIDGLLLSDFSNAASQSDDEKFELLDISIYTDGKPIEHKLEKVYIKQNTCSLSGAYYNYYYVTKEAQPGFSNYYLHKDGKWYKMTCNEYNVFNGYYNSIKQIIELFKDKYELIDLIT